MFVLTSKPVCIPSYCALLLQVPNKAAFSQVQIQTIHLPEHIFVFECQIFGNHRILFCVLEVSKSIVDKVIKPGRDNRDNTGWVEAQLKGEAQPASGNCLLSIPPERGSQPWHYWHWALHNPLLHVLCCTLVGGCLAASLHSIHHMPVELF